MKSPSTTNGTAYTSLPEPTAPSTQFVRRGFHGNDLVPQTETQDPAIVGTVPIFPLVMRAAFRRKLLAIIALQIFTVCIGLITVVELGSEAAADWIETQIVQDTNHIAMACVAMFVLLVLLYCVRRAYPLNWGVLLLFTASQMLLSVSADVALGSHVVLFNCIFTGVSVTLMAGMAGWTYNNDEGWCGLLPGWSPMDDWGAESRVSRDGPKLLPVVLSSALAFAVSCAIVAVLQATHLLRLQWSFLAGSLLGQVVVGGWIAYAVGRLHRKLTPDAYMNGVVFLYADLISVVATLGVLALAVVCVVSMEGEGVAAVELGGDCCCSCRQEPSRSKILEERV